MRISKKLVSASALETLKRFLQRRRSQVLVVCSLVAAAISRLLELFTVLDSDHYMLPWLIAFWLLWALWSRLAKPFKLEDVLQLFPSWNFLLFVTGLTLSIYPFSVTLQNFGLLPILTLVCLLDALLYAVRKHGLDLGTVTAAVGLLVFGSLWQLAGRPDPVVLPVDLPEIQNPEFTSDGVTNALLHAIESFPLDEPPLALKRPQRPPPKPEQKSHEITGESIITRLRGEERPRPFLYLQQEVLKDSPHIIGKAQLGGINLEPIYHTLRHLRHKPTLEVQVLIGEEGSLTLALRRSDFPPVCFSDDLPDRLLGSAGTGEDELQGMEDMVVQDIADERRTTKALRAECNPTWGQRVLSFLGLSDVPGAPEERISNVTTVGLRPDEQLTQMIQRAVLEGMAKISPAALGYYYEVTKRPESALNYYRQALPLAVQDAVRSRGAELMRARRRIAYLLAAIADLEVRPKKHENEDWQTSTKKAFETAAAHYRAAVALLPHDPVLLYREGSFLFTNSAELRRDGIGVDAEKNYDNATTDFQEVIRSSTGTNRESDLGREATTQLQHLAYEGLATVLTLEAETPKKSDAERQRELDNADTDLNSAVKIIREAEGPGSTGEDPENFDPETLTVRGRIFFLQGNCTGAKEKFERAFYLLNEPSFYTELTLGGYEQAVEKCGNSPEKQWLTPLVVLHRLSLATEHYNRGLIATSYADISHGVVLTRVDKGDEPPLRDLRRELHAEGLSLQGDLLWERACLPERFLNDGEGELSEQKSDQWRLEAISDLVESKTSDPRGWENKDQALLANLLATSPTADSGALARALAGTRLAIAKAPGDADTKVALATLQLRYGDLIHALEGYEAAAMLSPSDPRVHYLLGFALMENGEIERGSDEWKFARALDPSNWQYLDDPLSGCGPILGQAPSGVVRSSAPKLGKKNSWTE